MSEINKINANQPFDVRINPSSPDPRDKRETTVTSQDQSKAGQDSASSKTAKKSPGQSRRSSAMEDMLETLRKEQLDEDQLAYKDSRYELYRERNRQASEEYIQRLKDAGKEQTQEVLKDRRDTKQANQVYQSRIEDISRSHIQKMLKARLDDSTFEDAKNTDPDEAKKEQKKPLPSLRKGLSDGVAQDKEGIPEDMRRGLPKLDTSRFRPELSRMLEGQKMAAEARDEEVSPEGRSLLENAIQKIKKRLGGAHQSLGEQVTSEFKPALDQHRQNAPRSPLAQEAPIRTDLLQVEESLKRSQALKEAADGSRYVPLEDADVHKILIENKLPVDYASVQAIKYASRALLDSSYHFQRAVGLMAHLRLPMELDSVDLITDALRMYEKYGRSSIMNKLFRYLAMKKYMMLYQQLRAQESHQNASSQLDLGQALLHPEKTEFGLPQGPGRAPAPMDSRLAMNMNRARALRSEARIEGLNLPPDADEVALKAGIRHLLKSLGLPASKVMVNQLLQSAQGNVLRAQALVLQLAAGRSLQPEAVSQLTQKLANLSDAERQLPTLDLMEKLNLPIPASVRRAVARNAAAPGFDGMLQQLGLRDSDVDKVPLGRESLLLLQSLGERTETLQQLLPKLAGQLRSDPGKGLQELALRHEALQQLGQNLPQELQLSPGQQNTFVRNLMLALEVPPERQRAWDRVLNSLRAETRTEAEPQRAAKPGPESASIASGTEAAPSAQTASTPLTELPEGLYNLPQNLEETYPLAREAILLLHLEAERSQVLNRFVPTLNQSLSQNPEALLTQLQTFLPALQQLQREQGLNVLPLLAQLVLRAGPSAQQESSSPGPFPLPSHLLERTLQRFYPDLSASQRQMVAFNLAGASPETLDAFSQLHRMLGLLEPVKATLLSNIWTQPQVYKRLAELGKVLRPVMDALELIPSGKYFVSTSFQNQLVQGLQSWFLYGHPEGLKESLYQWLQPETAPAVSLSKVREHLARFGGPRLSEEDLASIWQLSEGSRDKMDAMGILLRGQYPLISHNLSVVMQYISQLPPRLRQRGVADILLYLSPQLTEVIDRQIGADNPLAQLNGLLRGQMPLQAENWTRAAELPSPNALSAQFRPAALLELLAQARQNLPLPQAQDLAVLEQNLKGLDSALNTLRASGQTGPLEPEVLSALLPLLQALNQAYPRSLAATESNPPQIQAWISLFQANGQAAALSPGQLRQLQDGLTALLMQVQELLPALQERLATQVRSVPADPEALSNYFRSALPQTAQSALQQASAAFMSPLENLLQELNLLLSGALKGAAEPWQLLRQSLTELETLLRDLTEAPSTQLSKALGSRLATLLPELLQQLSNLPMDSMPQQAVLPALQKAAPALQSLLTALQSALPAEQRAQLEESASILQSQYLAAEIDVTPSSVPGPLQNLQALNLNALLQQVRTLLPGLHGEALAAFRRLEGLLQELNTLLLSLSSSQPGTSLNQISPLLTRFLQMTPTPSGWAQLLQNGVQSGQISAEQAQNLRGGLESLGQEAMSLTKLNPESVLQLLQDFVPQLSERAQTALRPLMNLLQELQTLLPPTSARSGTPLSPELMPKLVPLLSQLLTLRPANPAGQSSGATSLQAWLAVLQEGAQGAAALTPAQVTTFAGEWGTLLQVAASLAQEEPPLASPFNPQTASLTEAAEESEMAKSLAKPMADLSLEEIQTYLQKWGLSVQNPNLLQEIQSLMQGSPDRLDAMAMLLKGHAPLLPAHIEIVAQYVKKLPPLERFQSISKILSFLSDELIAQMKTELKEKQKSERKPFPGALEPSAEEQEDMETLLRQSKGPIGRQSLQAARYLAASSLPRQPQTLQAYQHLLTHEHQPQNLLGGLERVLQQVLSLLPQSQVPAALEEILETLQAVRMQMQPRADIPGRAQINALSSWMQASLSQLNTLSERLKTQVQTLQQVSGQPPSEDWLDGLLSSLLGLLSWLAKSEPRKAEQCKKMRHQVQEQMQQLRQSLTSLGQYHQQEVQGTGPQGPQHSAQPALTQYLPAFVQSLGYPLEILVRQDQEQSQNSDPGQRQTEVQLKIQTHSLGQVYLSLQFRLKRLRIRVGVENRKVQLQLRPALEQLNHQLEYSPWELDPVQVYVMPAELAPQPVIAQHLHRRLSMDAI